MRQIFSFTNSIFNLQVLYSNRTELEKEVTELFYVGCLEPFLIRLARAERNIP